MDLKERLLSVKERENAGSRTIDRLDFQTCWGVSHLLELHKSGLDYGVAFEFHDDVVVIDNVTSPQNIRFFQIKGRSNGNWTMNSLFSKGEGESSIIGKMYQNKIRFGDKTEYLSFVSNQAVTFLPKDKVTCLFSEASKEDFDAFIKKLKSECVDAVEADGNLFRYDKTEFGIAGYEKYLKGALMEFISKTAGDADSYPLESFYLTILDRCRRKSKRLAELPSLDALLESKFVCRADVNDWIENLIQRAKARPRWDDVSSDLSNWTVLRRRAVKRQWDKYSVDCLRVGDLSFIRFKDAVRKAIDDLVDSGQGLDEIVEYLLPILRTEATRFIANWSDDYVRAAILYEFAR